GVLMRCAGNPQWNAQLIMPPQHHKSFQQNFYALALVVTATKEEVRFVRRYLRRRSTQPTSIRIDQRRCRINHSRRGARRKLLENLLPGVLRIGDNEIGPAQAAPSCPYVTRS